MTASWLRCPICICMFACTTGHEKLSCCCKWLCVGRCGISCSPWSAQRVSSAGEMMPLPSESFLAQLLGSLGRQRHHLLRRKHGWREHEPLSPPPAWKKKLPLIG
ncbi:Rhodopsin-like GPCR transmembrane domain [Musa troglodytarum]|uniref:Rhodopsin-like GPCR transmembrane domain n=1 Tax=Musa troglodytarum TaxID=320322 RepID=A0A9E7FZB6_9LILI|nr:Rhodopsin-like GPCR transmembrane domain [Musa troglodytarum]